MKGKRRWTVCVLAAAVAIPIAVTHSQPTPVIAGSAAEWGMQNAADVVVDGSGNDQNAWVIGGSAASWGWLYRGADVSGEKYFTVANSPKLNFPSSDFTLGAYVRLTGSAPLKTIIDNRGSAGGYLLGISQGQRVVLRLTGPGGSYEYFSTTPTLSLNRWFHVAAVVSRSTSQVQFYIDGQPAGASALTPAVTTSNTDSPLLIGGNRDGAGRFNDKLDEVNVYNRALPAGDIARVMAPGTPTYQPATWNDAAYRPYNNCYNYANNRRTNTFAQPGRASGSQATQMSCAVVHAAAVRDGLEPIGNPGAASYKTVVALVVAPGYDYHWYRRDANGLWTHKPGQTNATNLDNSQQAISNPETANRGPYSDFCGYFRVWSDNEQTGGHEQIN